MYFGRLTNYCLSTGKLVNKYIIVLLAIEHNDIVSFSEYSDRVNVYSYVQAYYRIPDTLDIKHYSLCNTLYIRHSLFNTMYTTLQFI